MNGTRVTPEQIVPEKSDTMRILRLTIEPGNKTVVADVLLNEGPEHPGMGTTVRLTGDISEKWGNLSDAKKADFKALVKNIASVCTGIPANEVDGDIWD